MQEIQVTQDGGKIKFSFDGKTFVAFQRSDFPQQEIVSIEIDGTVGVNHDWPTGTGIYLTATAVHYNNGATGFGGRFPAYELAAFELNQTRLQAIGR